MSRGKRRDWIRWHGGGLFSCDRCNERYEMTLPAPLPIVLAICKTFGELHAKCKKANDDAG